MAQSTYITSNHIKHSWDTKRRPFAVLIEYPGYPQLALLRWGKQCGWMAVNQDKLRIYAITLRKWRVVGYPSADSILLVRHNCQQPDPVLWYLFRQVNPL